MKAQHSYVLPRPATENKAYVGDADAKHVSNFSFVKNSGCAKVSNAQDLGFRQLCHAMDGATQSSSMYQFVRLILRTRCPSYMPPVYAIARPTRMRCVVIRRGRRSIHLNTNETMNAKPFSVAGHIAVSDTTLPERPNQARIGVMSQNHVFKIVECDSAHGVTDKRVAMLFPSSPVETAEPMSVVGLPALGNGAYTSDKHLDLLPGSIAQNASRAARPRRVRYFYLNRCGEAT